MRCINGVFDKYKLYYLESINDLYEGLMIYYTILNTSLFRYYTSLPNQVFQALHSSGFFIFQTARLFTTEGSLSLSNATITVSISLLPIR